MAIGRNVKRHFKNETGERSTRHVLEAVELLLALERFKSATRAARQLGTTAATVLRQLEQLEERLGVRLFDRSPTGLRATAAVSLMRPWAEQAQAAAVGMLRQLAQTEATPSGVVRLAVPPAVARLFVVPALPALSKCAPGVVLELAPATAVVDLAMREADLALRAVRPTQGELVAQRLSEYRLAVVGAKGLKPRRPGSRRLEDYRWVSWDQSMGGVPEARWLAEQVPDAEIAFRSSDLVTLLNAAQVGVGALVVADVVAERSGGLVPLDVVTPAMPSGALWLVAHQALRPVPRVAAVWDWLARSFSR